MGLGFALLGVVFVAYGAKRMREVDAALARGGYERPDARMLTFLTATGILLGVALAAIVTFGS